MKVTKYNMHLSILYKLYLLSVLYIVDILYRLYIHAVDCLLNSDGNETQNYLLPIPINVFHWHLRYCPVLCSMQGMHGSFRMYSMYDVYHMYNIMYCTKYVKFTKDNYKHWTSFWSSIWSKRELKTKTSPRFASLYVPRR